MYQEKTFWLLLVTLVTAGFATSPLFKQPYEFQLALAEDLPQPASPARQERTWDEGGLGEKDLALTSALGNAGLLTTDGEGNIFYADYSDMRVRRLSPQGELVRVYGEGVGDAPGELLNPSDIAIDAGGRVWVSDLRMARVTVFSPEGDVARTFALEHVASRVLPAADGGFTALVPDTGEHVFEVYDSSGRRLRTFGRLFPAEHQNALTLDGWLAADVNGGFVYSLLHAGWLLGYGADGAQRFFARIIDAPPLPKVNVDTAGNMRISKDVPAAALDVSVAGVQIFVLRRLDGRGVVDVYDLADGKYRRSLALPSRPRYLHVTECCFYALGKDGLDRWRRAS